MTSQNKTGAHPFYIGMYIHIYTHIYVHIYTSQKECLCIFRCHHRRQLTHSEAESHASHASHGQAGGRSEGHGFYLLLATVN